MGYYELIASYIIATLVSLILVIASWRARKAPGAYYLLGFFFCLTSYFATAVGEVLVPSMQQKVLFIKLEYTFINFLAPFFLMFVLNYTGRLHENLRYPLAILAVEPLITLILVWTNDAHRWMWKYFVQTPDYPFLKPVYGNWFWLHTAYAFGLIVFGIAVLVSELPKLKRSLQIALALSLFGVFMTLWGIGLYLSGYMSFNPAPMIASLTMLFLLYALRYGGLFDVGPIARDAILEHLGIGLVTLDASGRVIDVNPAMEKILGQPPRAVLHRLAEDIFAPWPSIVQAIGSGQRTVLELEMPASHGTRGGASYLEVSVLPLRHGSYLLGYILTFKDISAHKKLALSLEQALETEQEARAYAETLRETTLILTSLSSTQAILQELLVQVEHLVPYDSANISILRDNTMHIVEWRGYDRFGPVDFLKDLKQPLGKFTIDRKVIESNQPQIIVDTHKHPGWVVLPPTAWIRSHLIIPITHQDKILGLLRLDSATPGRFTDEDAEKLLPLANAAGIALANASLIEQAQKELEQRKRAEAALARQVTQLNALFRFTEELAPLLDVDKVCESVVRGIHTYLGFQYVGVFLKDENDGSLMLKAYEGWEPDSYTLKPGEGLSSHAVATGRVQYIADVRQSARYISGSSTVRPGSEVDIPLLINGVYRGVIVVEREEIDGFTPDDIHFLTAVGNEASIALSRAFTYARLQQAEAQYRELFNSVPVGLYLTTPAGEFLQVNQALVDILRYPDVETLLATPVQNVYVNLEDWEEYHRAVEADEEGLTYEMRLRCFDGDTIWVRDHGRAVRDASGRVLYYDGFIEDITAEVRAREERERYLARIQEQAQQMAALNAIFLEMSQEHDVQALLESITKWAVELLDGTGGGIYLAEPEREEAICVVSYNTPHDYTGTRLAYGEGAAGLVIATGMPQLIPDYRTWPNRATVYEEEQPFVSVISVPMLWGENVLGTIEVLHTEPNYFSQKHLELLTLLARQAAVALRNAQLLDEERKRHMELEALRHASLKVTSTIELSEVLSAILESALTLMPADDAHIFLYDGERLTFGAAFWGGKRRDHPYAVPRPHGATYTVARTGEPLVIPNADDHPIYQDWKWGGALVSLPLKTRDRVIGVMNVAFFHPYAFKDEDIHVLTLFADQAAIAIEHAELFAEKEEHTRELVILQNILQVLNASSRVHDAFPALTNQLQALTGAERISLALVDEGLQTATIQTLTAEPEELSEGTSITLEMTDAFKDILEGRIHLTPDLSKELSYKGEEMLYQAGYRSRVNIPLRIGDRILGALNLAWRIPHGFQERQLTLLQQLADALAMAIERDRLLTFTEEQAEELGTLYQTSLALGQTLELPVLLKRVLEAIQRLLAPDSVGIFSYIEATKEIHVLLAHEHGEPITHLEGKRFPVDQAGLTGWIVREARSILVGDLEKEIDNLPVQPRTVTNIPRSFVGVPLTIAERSVGVLTVQSFTPYAFSESHLRFLESLGSQLAILLENARAYEAEREAREQLEHLLEAAQALSATLNLQDVFGRILTELQKVVPYDSASVQELRGHKLRIIGGRGFRNIDDIIGQEFDVSQDVTPNYWVVTTQEPVILNDAPTRYEGFTQAPYVVTPIRSWLGVPMLYGDRLIGIITLDKQESHFYTEKHAKIARAFAAQAAIAIENARLYEAVQKQAEQVQRILDTIPDGVYLLDQDKRILMTNPAGKAFLDLFGLKEGAVLRTLGEKSIDGLLASKGEYSKQEIEIAEPEHRIFETAARSLGGEHTHAGWVLLLREVTQDRQIQAQVQQQERLAAVGQLAAGIAHDFNNILQGIIGFANLLSKRQDLPDDVRTRLRLISQQGERGAYLVRQMLDFSRRSTPHRTLLALDEVIRKGMLFWESALPSSIHLEFRAEQESYVINADKTQIHQIITNLIVNARDAMPEGGQITIELRALTLGEDELPVPGMRPGEWIVLAVSDTGTGIPKEVLPHIFEPFFSTKDVNRGSGLGLSQVYGLVQQHEGFIQVESEVGRGTTFRLYFPRRHRLDTSPSDTVSHGRAAIENHGNEGAVLVWLQDPYYRRITYDVLKGLGFRAIGVTTPEEAIAMARQANDHVRGLITETPPCSWSDAFPKGNTGLPVIVLARASEVGQIDQDVACVVGLMEEEEEAKAVLKRSVRDCLHKCT